MTSPFIRDEKVRADWEQSFIVYLYKGKGDMLCNYTGQTLTEQAMKVIERIADSLIRQVVTIDE